MSKGTRPIAAYEACVSRVRRADVHLKSLDGLLRRFVRGGAYEVTGERDLKTWPPTEVDPLKIGGPDAWTREVVLTARVHRQPPVEQVSLRVADVVNSLRATLDNLVWALSVESHTPPKDPIPPRDPWRLVAFPIVLKRGEWKDACSRQLRFVDPAMHTRFQRLQPFFRRKEKPWRDNLAVLDQLWNIDKHRHLHLTDAFLGLESVGSLYMKEVEEMRRQPERFPNVAALAPDQLSKHGFSIVSQHRRGPFVDRTELGRVRPLWGQAGSVMVFKEPPGNVVEDMQMDLDLVFGIAFKEAPLRGNLVVPTLRTLRDEVKAILKSFENDL